MRSKQQEPALDELLAIARSIGERAGSQTEQAEKNCKLADEMMEVGAAISNGEKVDSLEVRTRTFA